MSEPSAFGINHGYEIEKSFTAPFKGLTAAIPKQRAGQASKRAGSLAAHKGSLPAKTKSSLPLQAKLTGARMDRKKGTTKTPLGRG